MIKKIMLTLALCLPFLAGAQTIKIGLVNTQAIMTALPEYKTGQTELETLQKSFTDQRDQLIKEGQRMVEEFQALPADTAEAIKEHKAKAIEQQDKSIQEFMSNAQQSLEQKQNEIMGKLQAKFTPAIESVGKEGAYTLILPLDGGQVLYYGAPAEDITSKVMAKLGL